MSKPCRIQLRRTKGFRLTSPNGLPVVVVSRPSKWGNPWRAGLFRDYTAANAVADYRAWIEGDLSRRTAGKPPTIEEIRRELAGKNLACWCKDDVCHATVLLEIANSSPSPANHRRARRNGGGA